MHQTTRQIVMQTPKSMTTWNGLNGQESVGPSQQVHQKSAAGLELSIERERWGSIPDVDLYSPYVHRESAQ